MRGKKQGFDYVLAISVFSLVVFGAIMISSASAVLSFDRFGSSNYYLLRHIVSASLASAALIIMSLINYKFWKKLSPFIMFIVILLLVAVSIIGSRFGGAKSWIDLGFTTFQPTEFLKIAYILYLAAWLENRKEHIKDIKYGLFPFAIMTGFVGLLVIMQPDYGTASIILSSAAFMFVAAGATIEQILLGGTFSGLLGWILIRQSSHAFDRLTVFLNPSADAQGVGYHINQALLAIGSGGMLGLGFGMSRQKYHYLPEPMGDSIFAIVSEEFGFLRTLLIVVLFMVIILRGYRIARSAPDMYGRMVAFGITSWIGTQAVINIAAMLNMMPLTGIPLPFMSYGGSALISLMASVGILLNISKNAEGEAYESSNSGWRNSRARYASFKSRRRVTTKRR
ncbi:putative lipid II flippase FtsW [bacterium]|nr:putative lipid II flippase FtsW [bacterium]